ncbi:hypothetical protein K9M16_02030 [Candidatus Babeliales bacterium]|nr:hypothetical protein [Candidatus Babeliales bacterium]
MKKFIFIFLSCLLGAQTLTAGLVQSRPMTKEEKIAKLMSQFPQNYFFNFTEHEIEIRLIINKEGYALTLPGRTPKETMNLFAREEIQETMDVKDFFYAFTGSLTQYDAIEIKVSINNIEQVITIDNDFLKNNKFIYLFIDHMSQLNVR